MGLFKNDPIKEKFTKELSTTRIMWSVLDELPEGNRALGIANGADVLAEAALKAARAGRTAEVLQRLDAEPHPTPDCAQAPWAELVTSSRELVGKQTA